MSTVEMPGLPVAGQDPWDESLNACIQWLYEHVEALEETGTSLMSYEFSPETDTVTGRAAVPPGQLRLDNENQEAATSVIASVTTATGANARLALSSVVPGTILVLQQTAVDMYALATVSGNPVDHGDHFMIPLSSLLLGGGLLRSGMTGLSAAGISDTGVEGPPGPQGLQGAPGAQGSQGAQGEPGPLGPEGPVGPAGPAGVNGSDGPQGPTGLQGPEGATGPQGVSGPPGVSRSYFEYTFSTAVTTPPATGQVRLDNEQTSAQHLWISTMTADGVDATLPIGLSSPGTDIIIQDKDDSTKTQRYKITDTGVTISAGQPYVDFLVQWLEGDQPLVAQRVLVIFYHEGDPGPVGPQGPQGNDGSQGPQGVAGPPGLTGDTGATGPQGPVGSQGPTGADGLQGPAGPQGNKGDPGIAGATGTPGVAGAQGAPGAQGPQGPPGAPGVPGEIVTNRLSIPITVVNTMAETVVASININVTKLAYHFINIWGDALNTAGVVVRYQWRLRKGGLAGPILFDTGQITVNSNTSPRGWLQQITMDFDPARSPVICMVHSLDGPSDPTILDAPSTFQSVNPTAESPASCTPLTLTVIMDRADSRSQARFLGLLARSL